MVQTKTIICENKKDIEINAEELGLNIKNTFNCILIIFSFCKIMSDIKRIPP